jgi:hypothetical protein
MRSKSPSTNSNAHDWKKSAFQTMNHSPTMCLYKGKRSVQITTRFQMMISPHFRQSALMPLYKGVKLESYK